MYSSFNRIPRFSGKRHYSTNNLFVAISDLNKLGIKLKRFPNIIVIGPQSSGKSSVLEAICGKSILPKKMGMATKKPIHLSLIRDDKVLFQVGDKILQTEQETHDEIARVNNNTFIEKIDVCVRAPDVYNSYLIDLPGLFHVASENDSDTPKKIKSMNIEYLLDKNNIPIVVVAGATDPATNQALQLINKYARARNSMGIISKMDLLMGQNNNLIDDVLSGKKYPLGYGYVPAIFRSDSDISKGVSIEDKIIQENELLTRHFHHLNNIPIGTLAIRQKISNIQFNHIKENIPGLIEDIDKEIDILNRSTDYFNNLAHGDGRILASRLRLLIEKLVGSSIERAEFERILRHDFHKAIKEYISGSLTQNDDTNLTSTSILDPLLKAYFTQQNCELVNMTEVKFRDLFSYGLISPIFVNTEALDHSLKFETVLGCSIPFIQFTIDDPLGKKRTAWYNYLQNYFNTLLSNDILLNLVYEITEKNILDYILSSNNSIDDLTRQFSEFLIKEIGSETYESKIRFSIQAMINTEKRPNISILELVRHIHIQNPHYFQYHHGLFGKYIGKHKMNIEIYGSIWNNAYLSAVAESLAENIYRNVAVNLLDKMVEKLLEMTIDMFNKEHCLKTSEKLNKKILTLKSIRDILTSTQSCDL